MVSDRCPHGEFEVTWAVVNAVDKATAHEDRHNKGKFLNRQEFMQCLVRMAITVYCKRGLIGDVSDAVNQLMVRNLTMRREPPRPWPVPGPSLALPGPPRPAAPFADLVDDALLSDRSTI